MITLLVITDGRRDCIERTIPSALEHLSGPITERVIYDDSDDSAHRAWLNKTFGPAGFEVIYDPRGRQGFGGAIRSAWQHLTDTSSSQFVFHLEDDFVFRRNIDLAAMAGVLDRHPTLVQLALRRQPWNDEERAAGGIVEQHPADYHDWYENTDRWLQHRRFFTTNPSLYRKALCARGWPEGAHSEGRFGQDLLAADPDAWFGFWGERESGEWVEHTGRERVGIGY